MEVGTKYKILSIDEEREVQYFLKKKFLQNGYKFYTARDGKEGMVQLANTCPDLVLLDLILPDMDGIDLIRRMRQLSDCPLIVVSSKEREQDKVSALDAGADDYVTKPFGSEELLARIRLHIKLAATQASSSITRGKLTVNPDARIATYDGHAIDLTKKEFDLLEFLMQNRNVVVSREKLLDAVWGFDFYGSTNVVDVYVRYLRSKIDDVYGDVIIETVRGAGYVIR